MSVITPEWFSQEKAQAFYYIVRKCTGKNKLKVDMSQLKVDKWQLKVDKEKMTVTSKNCRSQIAFSGEVLTQRSTLCYAIWYGGNYVEIDKINK